eukprot:Rmarinus@m.59
MTSQQSRRTLLRQLVQETYAPCIVVICSDAVKKAMRKNSMDMAELLMKFVRMHGHFRFVMLEDFLPPSREEAESTLHSAVADFDPEDPQSSISPLNVITGGDVRRILRDDQDPFPWFSAYRRALIRTLRASHQEFFDFPLAILHVVSASEADPINSIVDLGRHDNLPKIFSMNIFDPHMAKAYVYVRNGHDEKVTDEMFNTQWQKMRQTFGATKCFMMCVNGAKTKEGETPVDGTPLHSPIGVTGYLTEEDLRSIQALVQNFITNLLRPSMRERLAFLNKSIQDARKGLFKNLSKTFFGRDRENREGFVEYSSETGGCLYLCTAVESCIRQAADISFMLGEYENAHGHYRMALSDFKSDKAYIYAAGCHEMMGLCWFMMDSVNFNRREVEAALDLASGAYIRAGRWRHGVKAFMVQLDIYRISRMHDVAATKIYELWFRLKDAPNLLRALLMEQSAMCYLQLPIPNIRKYGLQMILAGSHYDTSDQRKHSLRCFLEARPQFNTSRWSQARPQVDLMIGLHSARLGKKDEAVSHLKDVLHCCEKDIRRQEKCMIHFIDAVKACGDQLVLSDVKLPVIDDEVSVNPSSHRAMVHRAAQMKEEDDLEQWRDLEAHVLAAQPKQEVKVRPRVPNWLDAAMERQKAKAKAKTNRGGRRGSWDRDEGAESAAIVTEAQRNALKNRRRSSFTLMAYERRNCVVGEYITVVVNMKNPLQVPLILQDAKLECECKPVDTEAASDPPAATLASHVETEPQSFTLRPEESKSIQLRVRPLVEGDLNIEAVTWTLNGVVKCRHVLKPKKKRLNETAEQRKGKVYAEDRRLQLRVCGPMPLLEVSYDQHPPPLLHGEARRFPIRFTNVGPTPLCNLQLGVSCPQAFAPDTDEDVDRLSQQRGVEGHRHLMKLNLRNVQHGSQVSDGASVSKKSDGGSEGQPAGATASDSGSESADGSEDPEALSAALPSAMGAADVAACVGAGTGAGTVKGAHGTGEGDVETGVLGPGESVVFNVWLRGVMTGETVHRMLFYYESPSKSPAMSYRLLPAMLSVQVNPAVALRTFLRQTDTEGGRLLLGVEAINYHRSLPIHINRISCYSAFWRIFATPSASLPLPSSDSAHRRGSKDSDGCGGDSDGGGSDASVKPVLSGGAASKPPSGDKPISFMLPSNAATLVLPRQSTTLYLVLQYRKHKPAKPCGSRPSTPGHPQGSHIGRPLSQTPPVLSKSTSHRSWAPSAHSLVSSGGVLLSSTSSPGLAGAADEGTGESPLSESACAWFVSHARFPRRSAPASLHSLVPAVTPPTPDKEGLQPNQTGCDKAAPWLELLSQEDPCVRDLNWMEGTLAPMYITAHWSAAVCDPPEAQALGTPATDPTEVDSSAADTDADVASDRSREVFAFVSSCEFAGEAARAAIPRSMPWYSRDIKEHAGPLSFRVDVPHAVRHNFSQGAPCIIDVVVRVRNSCAISPVSFVFHAAPPKTAPQYARTFTWVGHVRVRRPLLLPGEEAAFPLRAVVLSPGIYDFNAFCLVEVAPALAVLPHEVQRKPTSQKSGMLLDVESPSQVSAAFSPPESPSVSSSPLPSPSPPAAPYSNPVPTPREPMQRAALQPQDHGHGHSSHRFPQHNSMSGHVPAADIDLPSEVCSPFQYLVAVTTYGEDDTSDTDRNECALGQNSA